MRAAEQTAIDRAAAGLTGERAVRVDLPVDAARGKLRLCEDALQAARGARALIDDKLHYAKNDLANAERAVHAAALRVIASEQLETLIMATVEARASYLESLAGLAWLIRSGAIPNGDVRPHQLVSDADTAPAHTDGGMAERLAALEGSP